MHLSHAQIGASLPVAGKHFRGVYRLLSNAAHSSPLSFQAQSNERGRGFGNAAERNYITLAIKLVVDCLARATVEMGRIFPTDIGGPCRNLVRLAEGPIVDAETDAQEASAT